MTLNDAIKYIENLDADGLALGRHDVSPNFYFNVNEYVPADEQQALYESHRQYIDIQHIVAGEEKLMITDIDRLTPHTPYDPEKDYILYADHSYDTSIIFRPGSTVVLFPKDAHRAVRLGDSCQTVRKVVGKFMIQ